MNGDSAMDDQLKHRFTVLTLGGRRHGGMIRQAMLGLVLVTTLHDGAGNAADRRRLESIASIKGECFALVVMGNDTKCDGVMTNQTWSDTRASFTFIAPKGAVGVTFSGLGSGQTKPDANSAVQPVDTIILTYGGKTEMFHAVGTCRFGNPYAGKAPVECAADTSDGLFRGGFISDGKPPTMKQFAR